MALRVQDLVNIALKIRDEFEVLFIVSDNTYEELLIKHNINYICLHCENSPYYVRKSYSHQIMRSKYIGKFLNFIKPSSIGQIIWQQIFYNDYQYYYKILSNIYNKLYINILVTINDRFYYPIEMALLKISKERKIPIVIPYIMNYNPDTSYLMLKDNPKYMLTKNSSLFQKIIFSKYKKQAFKNLYFLPSFLFVALERFKTLSKTPWVNGGGLSDIVIMSNEIGTKSNLKLGIDKKKLKILGDISLESIYNTYKNKALIKKDILNKYHLSDNKKVMIISLANWWEHNMADKKTHFDIVYHTIESALKFETEYNFLLILHPSMNINDYKFLENKYNIKIATEKTMYLLPIADIYITNYSSTVAWSILCNIKTLIVGYHQKLHIYDDFNSIEIVIEKTNLEKQLFTLINSKIDFNHDHKLLSRELVFNDQVSLRYKNLFHKLILKDSYEIS